MRLQANLGSEGSCAPQHSRSGAHPTSAHAYAQLLSGNTLVFKSSLRAYQITTAQIVLVGSWWTAGTQRVISACINKHIVAMRQCCDDATSFEHAPLRQLHAEMKHLTSYKKYDLQVHTMAHLEYGGIKVHPNAMLPSQIVSELAALTVQLKHRQHVCLSICFYGIISCLNFLCFLQTSKTWHDTLC